MQKQRWVWVAAAPAGFLVSLDALAVTTAQPYTLSFAVLLMGAAALRVPTVAAVPDRPDTPTDVTE